MTDLVLTIVDRNFEEAVDHVILGMSTSASSQNTIFNNVDSVGDPNQEEVPRAEDSSRNHSVSCPTTWLDSRNPEATPRSADIRECSRPNDSKSINQDSVPCWPCSLSHSLYYCKWAGP